MRTHKRLFGLIATLALLITSFSMASAQSTVTVKWWNIFTTPPELPALAQTMADEFTKAHPGVTIEITTLENEAFKERLATVMQSGDPPDMFQSWGGGPLWAFAQAGLLRDITPELTADSNAWKDTYSTQAALNLFSYQDKYYGVPWNFGAVGFWYNKELFAKAGIEGTPATWEDLLADIGKLKAAGITPIALGEKDKWPGHFWWVYLAIRSGGQDGFNAAYTRKGTFADPPFVMAGTLLKQLNDLKPFQDSYMGDTFGQEGALMGDGKAAMELMGQWAPGNEAGNSADTKGIPDKLGWFPFPTTPDMKSDPGDVLGGGDGIAFGKNAPPEAIEFAKYLTNADNQKRLIALGTGWLPTVKGAEDAVTDPLLQAVLAARNNAKYYQSYYDQFLPPAVANEVLDQVQGILAGSTSPQEAAQAIEDVAATELQAK